jgi:diguanylate cyclase (GGDEF)-like protein
MNWRARYDWKFVGRASVVIALVFAALLSSWVGIEAERNGKEAVTDASLLARRLFDVALLAYELETLQERYLGEALRTNNPAKAVDDRIRDQYLSKLAALRLEMDSMARARLEAREGDLLQSAKRTLEGYERIAAALQAPRRPKDRAAAVDAVLDDATTANRVAVQLRELGSRVSARAAAAADEASEAGDRARVLLVIFGGVSLLLALYLAHWLGDALAKAGALTARLAEMARIDALTGLPNRRVWEEDLGKGLDRARRTGLACAIGVIDLDHFKRYNDTHGHQAGDRLLREVAQALAGRMRAGDLIARYGGEEFAVLLHGCDAGSARKFFERLHGAMPQGATFSAGVSDTDGREAAEDVLKRADGALYRSKSDGRDRTTVIRREARSA